MCSFRRGQWFRRFWGHLRPSHQALGKFRRLKLDLDGSTRQFWHCGVGNTLPNR